MKKNLLLCLFILVCGIARGQLNDRIITYRGDTIKCKITKIENDIIYYDMKGADRPLKIESVRNIIIDKEIKRKINPDTLYAIYNRIRLPEDSFPIIQRRTKYFKHTLKINPGSFINEYTLKYEYRINDLYAVQIEGGYLHTLTPQLRGIDSYGWGEGAPFAFHGYMIRAGANRGISGWNEEFRKSIGLNFFYKKEEHEKTGFSGGKEDFFVLSRKRTVYGGTVYFSIEKYRKHFLVQFYGGISLRYIYDDRLNYGYTYSCCGNSLYDPPKVETKKQFLPAIQGGINIGFGFNGAKKKNE